jgi:hypothetical protein
MIPQEWIEPIGLAASAIIALSLIMNKIFYLRIINATGAAVFLVYGNLIGSLSIILLNGFIVLVNLYYLFFVQVKPSRFEITELPSINDPWFHRFWLHYKSDIMPFFPQTIPQEWVKPKIIFVLRDTLPVNLIVLQPYRDEGWEISVDYVIPKFRDFRSGAFFFQKGLEGLKLGKHKDLIVFSRDPAHKKYLEKMGFHKTDEVGELVKYIYFAKGE